MKNRKISAAAAAALLVLTSAGCGASEGFEPSNEIAVISREDGSGTRGAFIELFGVEEKDAEGNKIDRTTVTADITDSTAVMMASVAANKYAIGYISLGSMQPSVKALTIDGVEASVENIKNGSYKVARPFNIAVGEQVSEGAQDFIAFIMSANGQSVIEESGYIAADGEAPAYSGAISAGRIVVAGSSSVTPVMEKLKEAYLALNPEADIEINQSDSTTGVSGVISGLCDIGMASRDVKESELEQGVTPLTIAMDGIAVIVSPDNPVDGLTGEQVRAVYTGEAALWSDVGAKAGSGQN